MSNKELARRTLAEVYFEGVDISMSIREYLKSISYTDNEEDEADDLQIQLEDREGIWLTKWLDAAVQAAASAPSASEAAANVSKYKVTAKSGLNVRSGPGTSHGKLGALTFGTEIEVYSISGGWASVKYSGKDAFVSADYIQFVSGPSGGAGNSSSGSWAVGDAVIANGKPQYSSWGVGKPGAEVTNYRGSVTQLNLRDGIPYPIHVGYLGWFSEAQVQKEGASDESESGAKGLNIQALFVRENWHGDGSDLILDCGEFELDSVDASGPPSEVTIKCTSLPYKSQIRQTKKTKAWEEYTLSGIAEEMAKKSGMACIYESDNDPYYDRLEQIEQSDISFLSYLCHNAGISVKATNNIIVLFDQVTYESKEAVKTITKGDGSYIKYKLSTGKADTEYASCHVSYTNPETGTVISGTAYVEDYDAEDEDNQTLEITAKVSSTSEARQLAGKMLRLKNKYEYSASFSLYGEPSLVAGVTVMLAEWGPWSGKYIIKQAKHALGSSGYTTQLSLRRVLEGY